MLYLQEVQKSRSSVIHSRVPISTEFCMSILQYSFPLGGIFHVFEDCMLLLKNALKQHHMQDMLQLVISKTQRIKQNTTI